MSYEYDQKNTFATPHRYMYTSYEGPDFFKDFFQTRDQMMCHLRSGGVISPEHVPDAFPETPNQTMEFKEFANAANGSVVVTNDLLWAMYALMRDSDETVKGIKPWLDYFVKRYEVSRRVDITYCLFSGTLKRREDGEGPGLMNNYIVLALLCLLMFQRERNFKYLNCALKIHDLLSAEKERIENQNDRELLYQALVQEKRIVKMMLEELEVPV